MLRWMAFTHLFHFALAMTPATLPPTVPSYLTMYHGSEDHPLTEFEWYVPHKFYRITKIEVALPPGGYFLPGFIVTFQPCHADMIGWPDEIQTFGDLGGATYTPLTPLPSIDLTTEILEAATCLDWWGNAHFSDLERFKIKDENGFQQD